MARASTVLLCAVIGTALALLDQFYLADAQTVYAPQTTAEWIAFYVGLCAPWALFGAIVGVVLGRRNRSK
jgi:hypothetical protein